MKRKKLAAKNGEGVRVRGFPVTAGREAQESAGLRLTGVWVAGGQQAVHTAA